MKRPLKIKKEKEEKKERKKGKRGEEKKWKMEGRETIKQRSKMKEQNKGTRKKEQKYSVRNRNEKNNIFSLLSDADVVKYVRGADPAALTELMFD